MKRSSPSTSVDREEVTRQSMVERLVNLEDQQRWQEFFDRYWRLIYGVARKSGLNDAESQDVVQETVIAVAKNITKYERQSGSFKSWMLQVTRWRIVDQIRKRAPGGPSSPRETGGRTATIDRLPSPEGYDVESEWEREWQENLLAAALDRVKRRVDPRHYQIFDCAVFKQWPAAKVAKQLGVSIAQVYLVRHRIGAVLKREIKAAERRA